MTEQRRRRRPRARRQAVRGRGARGRLLPRALRRVRRRGLRPLLQHHRQPDAVVHPALPLGPQQRAGHPPARGRRLRRGLPAGQPRPRRGRRRRDRGPARARRDGPRLPPLHAARDGPRGAPGRLPAPLRPHPVDPAGRLAGAADEDPRGDLPRPAGQRHHRLPHAVLPAQLPAVLPRPDGPRGRLRAGRRRLRRPRGVGARVPAADRLRGDAGRRPAPARAGVRGAGAVAPPRVLDPARRPRGPVARTSCAGSPRSTSSSSSTRSSPSGSRSRRS